jgi:DNA-3-methyladenine glycosylase II
MNKILPANSIKTLSIKLPRHYRVDDFLLFHQRDQQMLSEHVQHKTLCKGIVWQGKPALLRIEFKKSQALAELLIDGKANKKADDDEFEMLVARMFGLQQNISEFEEKFKEHTLLGALVTKNPGLRVAVTSTPYEALTWAITGQQISVSAAVSIRRRFIQLVGLQHSSGLYCYPDENIVSNLSEEQLRQVGFSAAKANTLIGLSQYLLDNKISLNGLLTSREEIDELSGKLLQIRGIGPWSINYALLRGFGWLDGSLHGDVAVRRSLQKLLASDEQITEKETQKWLLEFSPWRALVAAHLWAMHSN